MLSMGRVPIRLLSVLAGTAAALVVGAATVSADEGYASWYGPGFQGNRMANGQIFDQNDPTTTANNEYPMGTWLRVTNLKNRRTTFVRVNDRGPVLEGRIVDLSAAAARAVGLAGVGKVKLEAVRESDPELAKALVAQVQMPAPFPLGR